MGLAAEVGVWGVAVRASLASRKTQKGMAAIWIAKGVKGVVRKTLAQGQ